MAARCLPLLEPRNIRFATQSGAKPVFLSPAERRLFFAVKGAINTDCTVDDMNKKLLILLPSIPPTLLKPLPSCPIPGVFPPAPAAPLHVVTAMRPAGLVETCRAAPTIDLLNSGTDAEATGGQLGALTPVRSRDHATPDLNTVPSIPLVGGVKRKRHNSKTHDASSIVPVSLPVEFSAHSPAPLLSLLTSWPNFTPSGEPCCWNRMKDRKIKAPLGSEIVFQRLSGEMFQNLMTWGIVGDLKKDDVAWKHLSSLLTACGISRPAHSAAGMMIRWLVANIARYVTSTQV